MQAHLMSKESSVGEWRAFSDSLRKDGLLQLYRGSTSRIISAGIGNSFLFGLNSTFQTALGVDIEKQGVLTNRFIGAAVLTGIAEAILYTPFEIIKLRMQVSDPSKKISLLKSVRQIIKAGGFSSFYLGLDSTLAREISGNVAYFTSYYLLKLELCKYYNLKMKDATFNIIFLAGGLSGVAFWLVSHPFDTLKSIQQTDDIRNPKYRGVFDCYNKVSLFDDRSGVENLIFLTWKWRR